MNIIGYNPRNMLVMGESSGGHHAISLIRYLSCNKLPSLPLPGALFLMSPTTDLGTSHFGPNSSFTTNHDSDYTHAFYDGYNARAFIGHLPANSAETNSWVSPASCHLENVRDMFSDFPPTLFAVHGAETALDSIKTLRDRMIEDVEEEKVTWYEAASAIHIFMSCTWQEPERVKGFQESSKWYDALKL